MRMALVIAFTLLEVSRLFAGPPQFQVKATEQGFVPATIPVRANVPAKITFLRQTDKTCVTEVLIPDYNIRRELPLDKPTVVEFTPTKTGEVPFMCAMKMFRGKMQVQDK